MCKEDKTDFSLDHQAHGQSAAPDRLKQVTKGESREMFDFFASEREPSKKHSPTVYLLSQKSDFLSETFFPALPQRMIPEQISGFGLNPPIYRCGILRDHWVLCCHARWTASLTMALEQPPV